MLPNMAWALFISIEEAIATEDVDHDNKYDGLVMLNVVVPIQATLNMRIPILFYYVLSYLLPPYPRTTEV
jgi:hypothetical protein